MIHSAVSLNRLLEARHAGEVYVSECKMGAAGSRTLDGWALLPTWSPMTTIGYEIKVSRSDWVRDQKYELYREACHLFYVVAPKGIVAKSELPAGVGLLEPVGEGTGARLLSRVKPTRQTPTPDKLISLMAYALMWRSAPETHSRDQRAAVWRRWVEQRGSIRSVDHLVKGRMRQTLKDAESARHKAEATEAGLQAAAAVLAELGIAVTSDPWMIRRRVCEAFGADKSLEVVRAAVSALQRVEALVEATG